MSQTHTWRIINYDTQEIMESDSLGVILGVVKTGLKYGEKLNDMRFNHIDSPSIALDLEKYLNNQKRAIERIKKASNSKNIKDVKYWSERYKQQYK